MNITNGIETLRSLGLNIFLSAKVSTLPQELYSFEATQMEKTICLVGAGGPTFWSHLPHPLQGPHPIDHYSIKVLREFADFHLNGNIEFLFPHESITLPLQRLGRALGPAQPTPSGIDMCSEYGPWFAYRAVFLTSHEIKVSSLQTFQSPCEGCFEKLCLVDRIHCPVKKEEQYTTEQISYHASQSSLIRC